MEKYDSYRPSVLPWLTEIPSHWDEKRAKYLFKKEARPTRPGDGIVTCFRDGEVTLRSNRRTTGFTEATDFSNYQGIRKGDLVIHQMDAFAGSTGISDSDGMGTPVLSVCTPKVNYVKSEYFARVIRMMGLNGFIQSLYRGIRERSSDFRFDTFAAQYLPVPPLDEQKAIVDYLDRETQKIDSFIAAKEKELALLDELKQAEIANAVTHGLNPDAPMKPSGISWLGVIPAHWEVKKLKVFCKENKVKNVGNVEKTVLSLSYGNIIVKENLTFGLVPESYESYQVVQPGDIILRLTDLQNDHKSLRTGLVRNQGIITNAYVGLKISHQLPEYVQLLLHTYDLLKVFYSMGGGLRQSMTYQDVAKLYICFPSIEEQRAIVEYVEKKSESFSSMKFAIACEIDHLKEYKQRLIADAVTGQIKVC